jgi:peptide/nickel transport system ATP-binding protein
VPAGGHRLALACRPQLLIADEPTTGLDVTTQKTVMDLVVELTRERGMSTILITHDLGLAAAYCDRVVVMEKGSVVESAASKTIFTAPSHPYTRKLMRATPRPGVGLRDLLPEEDAALQAARAAPTKLNGAAAAPSGNNRAPLLVVESLVKEYPRKDLGGAFAKLFKRNGDARPRRQCSARSTASASRCIEARASVSSASPAAASPPRRPWSCA